MAGAWAFVLLTKVSPGAGLLWFALRREWRKLAIALGVTAAIALVTFAIWPDRWIGWIRLLTAGSPPPVSPYYWSIWLRLPFAIAFIVLGAWRGWRWPVVVGSTLALPVFYTISPSMLVGVLPYLRSATGRWLERLRPQASPGTGVVFARRDPPRSRLTPTVRVRRALTGAASGDTRSRSTRARPGDPA